MGFYVLCHYGEKLKQELYLGEVRNGTGEGLYILLKRNFFGENIVELAWL